ncbi:MAG: cell division transport system ATP-binding protein [Methylococcaceae bacterium NSP1-1]|jgi:cell division transport system ATP-binding protein|nr:cell division ATP-binding protein FtsE [Methylococcaceae bacterium]MDD1628918.1 cell division ATP-binding protein FtsE [Methylococcaceae bacterium]MDD1634881.1 cell division ATP-binding protein FtsE [Methylococcaceae bacterium]OYV17048.1 MAG: cell division transport system ATP-binding protein [Methylococcaceae bacterium NSP1-1]
MIKFVNVTKRYAETGDVLRNVSFHLRRGEIAFLTGHSGAGKSTLLRLIAAMERCSRGQILLDGQDLSHAKENQLPFIRRKMGFIYQDYKLLQDRTVFDNVALPLVIAGFGHHEIARRVRAALDKVSLTGKEKKYPLALSGGEQQRVGIARAVVNKPPIIIADEPTGNLDPELSEEIMFLFGQFQQVGVTVLIASHDISLITQLNHRVLKLDHGQLVSS